MAAIRATDRRIHLGFLETASALSPALETALAQVGPVKLPVDASMLLAERLCRSIVGQQLSVSAARSIWARLRALSGDRPLMSFLLATPASALRQCGLSGSKARALHGIAEQHSAGALEANTLGALDHATRSAELTRLWGVGQWTADMISIFYFGDEDVWPDGDVVARKTLERLTSRRRSTVRTAARFAPYRSRLAVSMWHHKDATPT